MAPCILTTSEFNYFATIIENIKTPLEHVSVMGKYIRKNNFGGLKSHDYHILMQQILPLSSRTSHGNDEDFLSFQEGMQ